MKQNLLNSLRLQLCMLVALFSTAFAGQAWGETAYYTLDGTITGGNNVYADASEITQNSYTWMVTGNTTINPWRIGGKSLTNVERTVYSTTPMASAINKVNLSVGAASSITVNSLTLIVASDANFNSKLDEVTATFNANSTITFQPTTGTEWATRSYYKFIFNVTVSGSSNRFVEFKKVEFYSSAADERTPVNMTDFTAASTTLIKGGTTTTTVTNDQSGWPAAYTYSSSKNSVATVDADGVITAVGKGTATITATLNVAADDENYKVGETTSKTLDITVNNPTHTATFSINGTTSTADFEEDAAITFPTDIADINGKTFVGWITETIDGVTDTAPTLLASATMGETDVTYYAVFATLTPGTGQEQSMTIDTNTSNIPTSYGDANTFADYSLNGLVFSIRQMYKNGTVLQWRASGNNSGTGTMYNKDAIPSIQTIVLTYADSDTNKNFALKVGSSQNPTSGTTITASTQGSVYTFDCSAQNCNYFVLTNGTGAGYLSSIVINYVTGTPDTYSAYCTSVVDDDRQEAGISFAESAYTAELIGEFTSPVLTNPNNLTVVWSSSEESVATVANGVVTLVGVGETIINAAFEGDDDYKPANANYTLTVQDSRIDSNPEFDNTELTIGIGATAAAPTLTKQGDGIVTYATSNAAIATVNETTGEVTGVAIGTAVITATVTATNTHMAGTATFTVTVIDPSAITFDFDNDYATLFPGLDGVSSGSGDNYVSDGDFREAQTATVNGVCLTVSKAEEGNQNNNRIWTSSPRLRMYSGTLTITAPEGYVITSMMFDQGKWNDGNTADSGTLTSDGWTGEAGSVVITIAANTQFSSINVTLAPVTAYAVVSTDGTNVTFYYDAKKSTREGTKYDITDGSSTGWTGSTLTSATIDESFADYTGLTTLSNWFKDCVNLPTITGLENLNTSNVTNMWRMFAWSTGLTSLDLSSFNTQNVETMEDMFIGCNNLESINLSDWNTASVINMYRMFHSCSKLETLDLSSFNTANVQTMEMMFYGCAELTTIYVSATGWSTASLDVEDGTGSFNGAGGNWIFRDCSKLVGGNGTAYNGLSDYPYAIIDGTDGNPGYLTDIDNPKIEVTVGSALYTTFVAPAAVSFPEEVTAYIVTKINEGSMHMEEVSAVPAGTAVVVKAAEAGTYVLPRATETEDVTANLLQGSDGNVQGGSTIYVLANKSKGVGFYPTAESITVPAGRAYLEVVETGDVKDFIAFDFGGADGIVDINVNENAGIYNLAGQRVEKMQKGIYVVGGKKVAVK